MKKEYKIYCLKHPISKEIRYVGVTTKSLNQRFYQHKYAALKKLTNTYLSNWIRSIYKDNLIPEIFLIEVTSEKLWEDREKFWISKYKNLTNQREGGRGIIIDRSYTSLQRSANAHKKKIVILDKNMNFYKEFESINKCASFLRIVRTSIGNAIKKGGGNCAGFYVLTKENFIKGDFPKKYNGKHKDVYCFNEKGKLLKKFNSLTEAFKFTNYKSLNSLKYIIKHKVKHKNLYFSYNEIF